jgi:translation initiation factor 1
MNSELEDICGGLPAEICEQLATEQQVIKIRLEKRKFGKDVTIIEGLNEKDVNLKKLASELKTRLATGGTYKNGRIELQGDHRQTVKKILIEMGFPPENILVIT